MCDLIICHTRFFYSQLYFLVPLPPGGGVRYCHIWAIWVCATVKGMVFKQFTLG